MTYKEFKSSRNPAPNVFKQMLLFHEFVVKNGADYDSFDSIRQGIDNYRQAEVYKMYLQIVISLDGAEGMTERQIFDFIYEKIKDVDPSTLMIDVVPKPPIPMTKPDWEAVNDAYQRYSNE